jgi:hypothetical protein
LCWPRSASRWLRRTTIASQNQLRRFGSKACQIPPGKAGAPDGIGKNPVFGQGELSVNRKEACAFCQLTGFQGSLMIAATSDQRNGGPS